MVQLLTILDLPKPLPPVLAGYCAKVLVARQKAAPEAFAAFFSSVWEGGDAASPLALPLLLPRLLGQIGSDAILQALVNLCVGEPPMPAEPGSPPMQQEVVQSWLPHETMVPALLGMLGCEDA